MPQIVMTIDLEEPAPYFAYRRILGLEPKRRVAKNGVMIEREFLDMIDKRYLSDVINQALNIWAVMHHKIDSD